MSGFGSDADLAQSKEAGFLEHLVKPIDAKVLDAAIQRGRPHLSQVLVNGSKRIACPIRYLLRQRVDINWRDSYARLRSV